MARKQIVRVAGGKILNEASAPDGTGMTVLARGEEEPSWELSDADLEALDDSIDLLERGELFSDPRKRRELKPTS